MITTGLTANAANYYVDPATGSMNNPGTSASPWSTLEAVFAANKTFASGDVINLRSGYHGAPTVKGVITGGTATIQPDTGAAPKLKCLTVAYAKNWVISGLDICPGNLTPTTYMQGSIVDINKNSSYITLQNCTVKGALDITGWTVTDWQNNLGDPATISAAAPYSVIANNTIQNVACGIGVGYSGTCSIVSGNSIINFYDDAMHGLGDDCIFEYNTVMNSYVRDTNHDDIFQSWSLDPATQSISGSGTVSRVSIIGNILISHTDPNQPLPSEPHGLGCNDGMYAGWLVENNLISTSNFDGINMSGGINCTIINNTVVMNPFSQDRQDAPWIKMGAHKDQADGTPWPVPPSGNVVRNNIVAYNAIVFPVGTCVQDHNILNVSGTGCSNFYSYFNDPDHLDFTTKAGSPAIDAGSTSGAPSTDIVGNTRTAVPDVGAYEYIAPPVISSTLTATGSYGNAFSYSITATQNPTRYNATNLPSGLSVNTATGVISGTPTVSGTFSPSISATNPGGTGSATLALAILPPPPVITSSLAATGTNGSGFTYTIWATNNPTSYGATGLPTGLSVNTATGLISGTPTATGTFSSTISATNAGGTGSATLVLTVLPTPPVISSALTATAANGAAFSYNITASNSPTSFNASGLPSGLSVNTATGLISGTTTATGTSSVTISASNAGGAGSATLVLTVLPASPVITSALTVTGTNGQSLSYTITASNSPTSYNATNLPSGLSVNTATGVISGTPTAVTGTFSSTISATNAGGTGSATLVISILPANICYEGFDYAVTNNIGTAPDSPSDKGFTGTTWSSNNKVVSPGLSYSGMPSLGNAIQFNGNIAADRSIDMTAMPTGYTQVDGDSVTRLGKPGTTLWFRFLIRADAADPDGTLTAQLNLLGAASGGNVKLSIGDVGTSTTWSLLKQATLGASSTPIVTGSTTLLVVRVKFVAGANNDEVDLFVNPPMGPNAPTTPDATLRNLDISTFDRVEFKGNRQSTGDEVSIATDWSSL